MSDDVYVRMCRSSPLQKDWKPKKGDRILYIPGKVGSHPGFEDIVCDVKYDNIYTRCNWIDIPFGCLKPFDGLHCHSYKNYVWLLRQEDWQRIWHNDRPTYQTPETLDRWLRDDDNFGYRVAVDHLTNSHEGYWNLLWCVFVHDKLYKLTWDWENNKWVEE